MREISHRQIDTSGQTTCCNDDFQNPAIVSVRNQVAFFGGQTRLYPLVTMYSMGFEETCIYS